jgi:hypothetical protein
MQPHPEINVAQARAFWKDYSQRLYGVPRAWAHKGENLIHAFRAVVAASVPDSMHLNIQDQAFMLAGMAIEVQLKAILVNSPAVRAVVTGSCPQKTDPNLKLWRRFFSHNLVELALEANLPLTDAEQRVAIALSQYIYWRGRYVVPLDSGMDDFIPVELDSGLAGQAHHISVRDATELIDRVVAEVKARLYA